MTDNKENGSAQRSPVSRPRRKSIAILLAVFAGGWSWIYTWRWDSKKFLLGVIAPVALAIAVLMAPAVYDRIAQQYKEGSRPPPESEQFVMGICLMLRDYGPFLFFLLEGGVWWFWPVIRQITRSGEAFRQYPNHS